MQSLRSAFDSQLPLTKVRSKQLKLWGRLSKVLPSEAECPQVRMTSDEDEFEGVEEEEAWVPFEVRVEQETLRLMEEDEMFGAQLLLP